MNNRMQTDAWTYRIALVLAFMLAASLAGILALSLMKRPVPELLFVLGAVTASGLAQWLLPSPLSRQRLE